jgi:hypothetical protein
MFACKPACAQDSTSRFSFNMYAEMYYTLSNPTPINNELNPIFCFNHSVTNALRPNIIMGRGAYAHKRVRGSLGLMAGTYAVYNLSSEPKWAQYIYEANIGVKLKKDKALWLEAGVFESYMGYENVVSLNNPMLSRCYASELSPYYMTGVRLLYTTKNEKWNMSFNVNNGWQHIVQPVALNRMSVGVQLSWQKNKQWLFNYSNFFGAAYIYGLGYTDSIRVNRMFHDFYAIYQPTPRLQLRGQFDIGIDDFAKFWFQSNIMAAYDVGKRLTISARAEWFMDAQETLVYMPQPDGSMLYAFSGGIKVKLWKEKLALRAESKYAGSTKQMFINEVGAYQQSQFIQGFSLSMKL